MSKCFGNYDFQGHIKYNSPERTEAKRKKLKKYKKNLQMRAFKTYTHYIHIEKSNDKPEKSETVFVY